MTIFSNRIVKAILLVILALFVNRILGGYLESSVKVYRIISSLVILGLGGFVLMSKSADIIEETTSVLSERTKLAGGFLQAVGTAFPDMVLGLVAAIASWKLRMTDYTGSVNLAIIAASTTFGSNIYNVVHASWCIFRQNQANLLNKKILMFPFIKQAGMLTPFPQHQRKPTVKELDAAIDVSMGLTMLTSVVAISMVVFGRSTAPEGMVGELYQLMSPVGLAVFILGALVMYFFRKRKAVESISGEVVQEENYYRDKPTWLIWLNLFIAGIVILLAAEGMVMSIKTFCQDTGVPYVIAGVLAGIIGCLGEMMLVHNYSVHPKGRIGDAVMGVAMDNIATIMVAAMVAVLGGIFLGGDALLLIFVVILAFNSVLMWQISNLKNYL